MSTGTYIVQSALQRIGAHTKLKPANPTSLENGMKALNSYISGLQDCNIEFGAVPLKAIGDELSEPKGITNKIINNLAILLQPDHPGSQISTDLRINANKGERDIKKMYKTYTIPKQVVRETLVKGQGNNRRSIYNEEFFDQGETIG